MKKNFLYFVAIWMFCVPLYISAQNPEITRAAIPAKPTPEFKVQKYPPVQQYIKYYQGRDKPAMEDYISRSGQLDYMMRRIFREEGVPENLVNLSRLTNTFHINGLWIIDKEAIAEYNLKRTEYLDQTRSFEPATRAVAVYLRNLSKRYNKNWELVMAAYFEGKAAVDRAVRLAKSKKLSAIQRYLRKDTYQFVCNVLAIILIMEDPNLYGFENVKPAPRVTYDSVRIPPSIGLDLIAQFADSNPENIKRLNPELISIVTPPQLYVIRIPEGKAQIFMTRLRRHFRSSY